jgi:hypothetical protein
LQTQRVLPTWGVGLLFSSSENAVNANVGEIVNKEELTNPPLGKRGNGTFHTINSRMDDEVLNPRYTKVWNVKTRDIGPVPTGS